jgi:hypothetical protein
MLNRKTPIFFSLLLISVIATASAVLLLSHNISTTMLIKPAVSMGVFDTNGSTPLTFIDLGQFQLGSVYHFPGHVETTPTQFYFINNTDQVSFYVAFDIQNPDPNIQWNFAIKRGDKALFEWVTLAQIYSFAIETPLINGEPTARFAYFYFRVTIGAGATFGTYTPTILIKAFNSTSG